MIAALVILGAAICAVTVAQSPAVKRNPRQETTKESPQPAKNMTIADDAIYSYEFQKSEFYIRHIVIKHNANGRGEISFEKQGDEEPIVEPLALSDVSLARVMSLWEALRFLDSNDNYQSERQYPQMGTMRLKMTRGTRERVAEFNWTNDPNAKALADEYRRVGNQAIFIFDITVARENQPLNSPKLLDLLDSYIDRKELSDPQQLIPLIQELSTDERLPLIARNHAGRILKKLGK
jgi:hypothetical protein